MIVCIDTNVVLGVFTTGHRYRPIFESWLSGRLTWAVTTEILFEYDEIMVRQGSPAKALKMRQIMQVADRLPGRLIHISPSFRFNLISRDSDDNKFVDCAIAAEADYIITSDHHFDEIVGLGYKPQPIAPDDFICRCL